MANPQIDMLKPRDMTNAILQVVVPEPFVLDKFFKSDVPHSADTIDAEFDSYGAKMAKVVGPYDEAVTINKGSRKVQTIVIPRTFEKKVFHAQELADYETVGNIYAENSAARIARQNEWILQNVEDLKNRVIRLREWMAIQALSTGKITISNDMTNYEADFGFATSTSGNIITETGQIITLSASQKWNATTPPDILAHIRTWKKQIMQRSGFPMDNLLLGEQAASDLQSNDKLMKMLWATRVNIGTMTLENQPTIGAEYLGKIAGVDIWAIEQQYNVAGTQYDMLGANLAIALSSRAAFRKHSGPVYRIDPATGKKVAISNEFYVEPKVNEDRTMLEWKCEQKSVPVVHQAGSVIAATVHA